jgi:predicted nucleic acid-binding protein
MRPILIDTNLLCLIVAGGVCPEAIGVHKRLRAFAIEDYRAIVAIGRRYTSVLTCPHVLAETSNLLAQTNDRQRAILLAGLADWIGRLDESGLASGAAVARPEYRRLGLTDAVLVLLALNGATLLTVDLPLYLAATAAGCAAINYNYVRDGVLDIRDV